MKSYIDDWNQTVISKPKLRTYAQLKSSYGVENYVKLFVSRHHRSLMAQLRLSILPIRIETGRFVCESLEQRICKLCERNEIEAECHVMFDCPSYSYIRNTYLDKIDFSSINSSENVDKLKYLCETHPYIFGNLLGKIMIKRKSILYK